jgi:hypothetical protein
MWHGACEFIGWEETFMRTALTLSIAALMITIPGMAQTKTEKNTNDSAMAEAIRFERAKAVADARQAKLEAQHPCGCASPEAVANAGNSAAKTPATQRAANGPKK